MSIKRIKNVLIISMIWIVVTQMLSAVFFNNNSFLLYVCTLVGECIFLFGLILLDRIAKSMLSGYYAFMLCISFSLYVLRYFEILNLFVLLILLLLFLFSLYKHLQIFTHISGQALFVRSFYILLCSILVGFMVLVSSSFMRSPQVASFVFGAMVLPALFTYLVALFSLQNVSLEKLHKSIT